MVRNKNLYGLVATFAICLALVCSLYSPSGATAVNNTGNCTIAVSGSGTIEAEPNQAKVSLGVETQSENVTDALNENSLTMSAIIAAMGNLGYSMDKVRTSYFSISPVRNETDYTKIVAYKVHNEVTVEISDLDEIGEVISKAADAGANNVQRIEFGLTEAEEKELKNEAIKKACEDAESKADAIANSFGLVNLRVASVRESSVYASSYRDVGMFNAEVPMAKGEAIAPPINPKAVEVKATIEVVYECS
ncbi:MAG: SIMPL domain-containing protein [Halobacteriota archaeon]